MTYQMNNKMNKIVIKIQIFFINHHLIIVMDCSVKIKSYLVEILKVYLEIKMKIKLEIFITTTIIIEKKLEPIRVIL